MELGKEVRQPDDAFGGIASFNRRGMESGSYLGFFECSPIPMMIIEILESDLGIISANAAAAGYFGRKVDEFEGRTLSELGTPDVRLHELLVKYRECEATKKTVTFLHFRENGRDDGSSRMVFRANLYYMGRAPSGKTRCAVVVTDLTESCARESELGLARQRLELSLAVGKMGTWDIDVATGTLHWSHSMRALFGIEKEGSLEPDLVGFFKLLYPGDRLRMKESVERCIRDFTEHNEEFRVELPSGEIRWIHGRGQAMRRADGSVQMCGVAADITDRKFLELTKSEHAARVAEMKKMSALGQMAGCIAHEINNPLTIIKANIALLRQLMESGHGNADRMLKIAYDVDETTARIVEIVEGLRNFSRDGERDEFIRTDLREVFQATLPYCKGRLQQHRITLDSSRFAPELFVMCRSVQISQVFLNLINNSIDAVSGREARWISVEAHDQGEAIEVSVTDSGPGISKEHQSDIFEPFFTLRSDSSGTGLGLGICRGILEKHGATIELDPSSERTRFVIRFRKGWAP